MKQKLLLLLSLLLFLLGSGQTLSAAITEGYYYVKSYNDKYLTENTSSHSLICSDLMEGNYSQVWYLAVDGTNVTFKNALTDYVIIPSFEDNSMIAVSPSEWSAQKFTVAEETGSVYTFTYGYDAQSNAWGLHCDGSNNVVKWYITEAKSKWTVQSVTVDEASLNAQKNATSEASAEDLLKVFTTTACTELRSGYSAADLDALPATAQALVDKISSNSWTTYAAGWDKTEKTFRIADYKAYSSHTRWTSILNLSYSLGRLANPTGIYVDAGDYIQVYVGEIPSGETVKLEVAGVSQSSGSVYTLHEGMNSLLIAASGNCFIQYEVDNTTNGGTPYKALSEYADVTVHIEGGTVQGYIDLTKGDTNTDWAAMKAYLLSKPAVCLKSKTHVFNLHRDRLQNGLGAKEEIVEMMTVWQNVAELEDNLMARSDFDDYCNCTFSVTTLDGSGNPYAHNYGTFYHEGSDGLFNADELMQNFGGLWTIAHEQGHNHQNTIKMAGTTEISNNMFSNAVVDWQGRFTSRVNSIQNTYNRWRQGQSWPERIGTSTDLRTWDCLSLYVQLYQYFHQAGFNTNFYPDLFRALRSDPMVINGTGAFTLASNDYLKFYKKCCDVAQLDLTEFFEVYGFFLLPPTQESLTLGDVTSTTYQLVQDYISSYLHVTQEMINEAKAYVAAKNYPKCNLIFIEDRVTAPLATYEGHAEGERRTIFDTDRVSAFGLVGETGQYTTFGAECSAYTYQINGTAVTMEGTGAVGFKVYDSTGKLRGVYNTYTFTLPDGIGTGYTIKAAAGDGTDVEATYDSSITWYYIQMQNGGAVLATQGEGELLITAEAKKNQKDSQLWKMIIGSDGRYTFVSRSGQTMYYDSTSGKFKTTANPTVGYAFQLVTTTNTTYTGSYEIFVNDLGSSQAYLNQWQGSGVGRNLGCWNAGDGNNPLMFIEEADMTFMDEKPEAVDEVTLTGTTSWTPENKHTLWYTSPATVWMTSTLPIGNGQFGGCIMGGVKRDEVQFNDKTLWWGQVGDLVGNGSYGSYVNFGNLYITSTDTELTAATNYRRWLDIDEARAGVAYTANGVDYQREYICSNPDKVIAIRYTASQNGKINENLILFNQNGNEPTYTVSEGIGEAVFSGTMKRTGTTNDESYYCQMKVVATGGTVTANGNGINVSGANEMVIYLFGGTNFDPSNDDYIYNADLLPGNVQSVVAAAQAKGYDAILTDHVADYKELYDRCKLNITSASNTVPTPTLISNFAANDANNLLLEEMYFSYGRYLMIGSSRGVDLPNNLQGIWNDNNSPGWNSDIHANINVQMNYWPAEVTNLSELHMPFLNYIKREACDRSQWQKNARGYAGQTKGWTLSTENNIYGSGSNWMQNYTIANAWYCMHLWQHYRYTLDTDYLRDVALPAMKSCCEYWMERLVLASDGTYECPNEYSPEHGPGSENATAHSQQLVWDLFNNTLQAYEVLNITNDAEFLTDLQNKFDKLDKGTATEVVNNQTLLREWKYTSQNDVSSYSNHRHLSHLMGLYPGTQIADDADPVIYQAAINSLNARGYEGTGWSMGWKINCHARAKDGDRCQSLLKTALHIQTFTGNGQGGGIYENLWDAHTPYQIDGNFGATSGMAEMLLQSHQNKLELLPALPSLWSEGSVTGLRAVDNFVVDIAWSEGKATTVTIKSNAGKTAVVKYKKAAKSFEVTCEGQPVAFTTVNDNEISFPTVAGKTYELEYSAQASEATTSDVTDVLRVGAKVTAENQLVSGKVYLLRNTANGNPWISDAGTYYSVANGGGTLDNACLYYLIKEGETWKIKNFKTGKYWGKPTAASTTNQGGFVPTDEAGAGNWTLNFNSNGDIDPQCNGFYINRSSQKMHGWSSSLSSQIYEIALTYPPFTEFNDKDISVSSNAAATVETGQWYVMFDRGANHGYLYENNQNKLYNTATVPSGSASGNAKYLVRIVGWNNEYYIQTGLGNFFGSIAHNTNVSTMTTANNQITLKKINGSDGHYYLTTAAGIILDANSLENGDATVVGWGSTPPNNTGGNNDWAFYPVEFVDTWVPSIEEVYTINNTNSGRGAMMYNGSSDYVWSSGKSGTFDATAANCQWVLVPTGTDNQYYIYNVGAQKFAVPSGTANIAAWVFSNDAVAVTLIKQGDGTFKIKTVTTDTYAAVSNNYPGPIINYNDVGGNFTITKVDGNQSTGATAALNKLMKNQTALTAVPTGEGWYAVKIKSGNYADEFVYAPESEVTYYGRTYPLTFKNAVNKQPAINNTYYLTHIAKTNDGYAWQLPNGLYLQNSGSNYFPTSTANTVENVQLAYNSGFKFSHNNGTKTDYAVAYYASSTYFIGESDKVANGTLFDIYPIDLATAGMTAWKVSIDNNAGNKVTCTRSDVIGQTSVYHNGYIFLPTGVTPATGEFTMDGMVGTPVLDTENHSVSVAFDPTVSINDGAVSVIQGNQTTGKGNTMQALLRIKLSPFKACTLAKLNVTLTGADQLDRIEAYTTTNDELRFAGVVPTKINTSDITPASSVEIPVNAALAAGQNIYLWITGDVKSNATEWSTIDAAITSIDYSNDYTVAQSQPNSSLDISAIGNPNGEMRIYKSQTTLWTSSTIGTKYYRIPALLKTGANTLLAFTDDRYSSVKDLGSHKIDVLVKKSTNGGLTWGDAVTVAAGDGSSDKAYGYGDAAVAMAANGDIICLMAAGKNSYSSGMLHIGLTKSTDGGATWSTPVDIYGNSDYLTNPHAVGTTTPFTSTFVSSGHGITQSIAHSGRIAFPALGKISSGTNEYIIYSDDNGDTWTITDNYGFLGADESKLEEMNDGNLLMSIRCGGFSSSNVARGYNRTTDTEVENWGAQGTWSDLTANGCNSDLLYYSRAINDERDVLLHSVVKSYSDHRKDLRLYMSFDQGTTWKEAFQLQPGWAAYSSMQVLDNGDLAILFEDGSIGNEDLHDCYDINYVTISSELINAKIDELYQELFANGVILSNSEDNTAAIAAAAGETRSVKLADRTLYKDGAWNTLCVPFSLDASALLNSPLATATIVELDTEAGSYAHATGFDEGTLYLNFKKATGIEAGKPYLVKWESGNNLVNPCFLKVTLDDTKTDVTSTDEFITFLGTYAPVDILGMDKTKLFMSTASTLYYPNKAMTIGSQRAFFQLNNGLTAGDLDNGVRSFVLNFGEGETTGVEGPTPDPSRKGREDIYDLQGRKVGNRSEFRIQNSELKRGLYIMNGKKVVIK